MYNSNNKQYIFRQSSGKVWNFYYDEKLGLCISSLTKRNTWSEPISLQKNINPPFFADIDYEDNFHIFFQDKQGNIYYSLYNNENIKTTPVLSSKSLSPYDKHLQLVPYRNNIHMFFVIEYNGKLLLSNQILSDGRVNAPKAIDYLAGSSSTYTLTYDRTGNIYAFYQSSDGKYLQMGYKKYSLAQKFWSEFIPVTKNSCDSEYPRVIIDNKNIIHMCYQRRTDRQHELVYLQKIPDKNIWSGETVLHSSNYPFNEASVLHIDESTIAYWVRDDNIYHSTSEDGGSTWSKPARYNFPGGRQLLCISYKTNSPYEIDKLAVKELPGNFINGFKLAFYQDWSNPAENISADDLRTMIVDGMKLLRGNVEELRDSISEIQEKISGINASYQDLEREITKYSLKMNLLENELNQVKNITRGLESLKNSVSDLQTRQPSDTEADPTTVKNIVTGEIGRNEIIAKNSEDIMHLKRELEGLKKNSGIKKFQMKKDNE